MGLIRSLKQKIIKDITQKVMSSNQLYSALQHGMAQGMLLDRDYQTSDYIDKGFEGNADVYAAIQFAATKFAFVPGKLKKIDSKGNKKEITNHPFLDAISQPNHYQTWFEFKMLWEIFRLVTGNSIIYAPRLSAGNNKGKLTKDGMFILPTQFTEIKSEGWRTPVGKYVMQFDAFRNEMPPEDIIHDRFPTMQYEQGRQYMGLSPLKAAIQILERQNSGYDRSSAMLSQGGPPGILTDPTLTEKPTEEQKRDFRKKWKEAYGDNRNANVPIWTNEGVQWIPTGFSSMKELDLVNLSQDARRVLASIIHIPAQLLNDPSSSTYNNMSDARKYMWTDRLKVDHRAFEYRINREILPAYGDNLVYEHDYSDIDELQEDKKEKSVWVGAMYNNGTITGNEYREFMDVDPDPSNQHLESYYINMNKLPAEQAFSSDILEEQTEGKENEFYNRMKINY